MHGKQVSKTSERDSEHDFVGRASELQCSTLRRVRRERGGERLTSVTAYDIVVGDLNMAVGALVLGQLTALRTGQHGAEAIRTTVAIGVQ
jgi:hypothetical protein